jgi:CO/xanthine dehydrogenase Mo-binding subunit
MTAKIVQRPVNLKLTRAQTFTSNDYRPCTIQKVTFAADAAGAGVPI